MAAKKRSAEEVDYLECSDATRLWAQVRDATRFTRRLVNESDRSKYNQRLLYLLVVAVLRRVEVHVKQKPWHELLQVTEAYAEGQATMTQLMDAYEKIPGDLARDLLPAANSAALSAVHFLSDDYKVIEGVDLVTDAAGYEALVHADSRLEKMTLRDAEQFWKKRRFLAAKKKAEQEVCVLIRDIFGNPFRPVDAADPGWLTWKDGIIRRIARAIYDSQTFSDLPVLGDAMEEAGCTNDDILRHCRGGGPHVHGCWVLDLILSG